MSKWRFRAPFHRETEAITPEKKRPRRQENKLRRLIEEELYYMDLEKASDLQKRRKQGL